MYSRKIQCYKDVVLGVTQGTILSPLIFVLCVNALIKVMNIECIILYADHTVVLATILVRSTIYCKQPSKHSFKVVD